MRYETFLAMGTEVVAWGSHSLAGVRNFFARAEATFSRFREDSELTALNNSDEYEVSLSPTMAACLAAAYELRDLTGGLVDPAVGAALVDWGYDTTFADVADRAAAPSPQPIPPWNVRGSVLSRPPATRLDLGGLAKGWTCDRAVELTPATVVSAGGDVRSDHPDTVVSIDDPWGEVVARVFLGVGGLATSSTTRRRWAVGDNDVNHIIDPRTLSPAESPIFSATAMAATAVAAEAAAKAVLLHGREGLSWAAAQNWIDAALVVWHDGSVYATTGWEMAA